MEFRNPSYSKEFQLQYYIQLDYFTLGSRIHMVWAKLKEHIWTCHREILMLWVSKPVAHNLSRWEFRFVHMENSSASVPTAPQISKVGTTEHQWKHPFALKKQTSVKKLVFVHEASDRDVLSNRSNTCSDTKGKSHFLISRRVQCSTPTEFRIYPPVRVHGQLWTSAESFQPAIQLSVALGASYKGSCLKSVLHSIFSHIKPLVVIMLG